MINLGSKTVPITEKLPIPPIGQMAKDIAGSYDVVRQGKDLAGDIASGQGIDPRDRRLGDFQTAADDTMRRTGVNTSSIIARAKNSVLQFPMYMTDSLRINEAQIIARSFERVYATMVQTVLSQNPEIDEREVNNLAFLKQFHTNLREAADALHNKFYTPIDEWDKMMQESVYTSAQISENIFVEFRVIPCINRDLIEENARLSHEPLTGLSYLKEAPSQKSSTPDPTPNLSELKSLIAELQKMPKQGLDQSSVDEIRDIIQDAMAWRDGWPSTHYTLAQYQIEVDSVVDRIRTLIGDVQKKLTDPAKDELDATRLARNALDRALGDAQKFNKTDLDNKSKNIIGGAISKGMAVRNDPNADISDINSAIDALRNAIGRMSKTADTPSDPKEDLKATIANARTLERNQFSDMSWRRMFHLLQVALRVAADDNATEQQINDANNALKAAIGNLSREKETPTIATPKLMKDTDVKKINDMLPFTIEASFHVKSLQGRSRVVNFIIGVKTIIHLISADDISEDLRDIIMGNEKMLQKVRYKTGEISRGDYLFNTKGLKKDAAKHIQHNKRWMNTLKRHAEYDKMKDSFLKPIIRGKIAGGEVPIPNGTIVLSQPDVSKLTHNTGIDVSEISNARALCKALFLIGIAIIDMTAGTMKAFFPDSDSDWDIQSLAAMDAEIQKTDNSALLREVDKKINR